MKMNNGPNLKEISLILCTDMEVITLQDLQTGNNL